MPSPRRERRNRVAVQPNSLFPPGLFSIESRHRQHMDNPDQVALWVLRAQCDDREALESLLRSIQPSLHRFLSNLVGPSDADDVLQEVLVLVYRKLWALETPQLFRPWTFRIAHRAGVRYLKRRKLWP